MSMSIQCPSCLSTNTANTVHCIYCGTFLNTIENTTQNPISHQVSYISNQNTINYLALTSGTLLGTSKYQKPIYEIEKYLGQGGFGITYQAIYLQNNTPVAIKELWPEGGYRQGATVCWPHSIKPQDKHKQLQKFQEEASNLQKCIHPHIVKVYDWFLENDTAYMVMELLSGKSLDKILSEEGILSEDRVKHYFLQIAESLKVIHSNSLLHRDIKPENIIIVPPERAVLIDFGAAREFIAGQTGDMTRILTPGYAPYEQYRARNKPLPATDFYALSASMYQLLTGELPAASFDRAGNLASKNNPSDPYISPRKLNSQLSYLMEQIINTGLQFDAEDRFQTADDLIAALNGKFISPTHQKAQELVKQGKLKDAIISYEKLLNYEINNGKATVELALVQTYVDMKKAEITAQKAIKLEPNDGRGYGVLGLVSCHHHNWKQAVKYLEKAANLSPQEIWIQSNLAWALAKCDNWQKAENIINQVLLLDGNCIFALSFQAWIYTKQKQWKAAVRSGSQAIFKLKQKPLSNSEATILWVYPYLIMALEKVVITQQANDVERRIQEFITQVPENAIAWGLQGWEKAKNGLWNDAIYSFEQASKKKEVSSWILINYGISYEHLQNYPAAIQVYELHNQKFPPHAFICFRLGTLYGKLGQWKEAKKHLEKAIQLNRNYAQAYHNLGWVLLNITDAYGKIETPRQVLFNYRKAMELYQQQQKHTLAADIQQSFQLVGINI